MKSTKVLAVLAGATLFTACSQEELFEANNVPQQMEEVVGAKLAGTDISMNFSMDGFSAQSRYAGGESTWGNSDVVGLGWILNEGGIEATQNEGDTPNSSALYANHMFGTEDEGATWSTKGNLYEGLYFAYYPWSYEAKAGKIKKYEMNPAMINRGSSYHYSQSLYLSNYQFVGEENIDKQTNSLSDNIKLYQAVKFIQIAAKAQENSTFAKGGELSGLQIDKVTISAGGKNIFANEVNIYAKHLPKKIKYSADETKAETDKKNLAAFRSAHSKVLTATKVSSINRNVEAADLLVSTNPLEDGKNVYLYLNVLPTISNSLTADDITVTFHSGAAAFVISNDENLSETNAAAFEALVAAYHTDGALSTINELDENGDPKNVLSALKLTFELCAEDFVTDFSSITNIDEWNDAVTLTQQLKRKEATFSIDGNIEFDGEIKMPEGCELTVIPVAEKDVDETETLEDNVITLKGTFEAGIPENLNIKAVDVVVEGTVKEAQTINAYCITNNGTLNLGKGTSVDAQKELAVKVTNNGVINMAEYSMLTNVDNKNRINIVYKSAIKLAQNGENGEVAYEVTNLDTPTRIQNVLNTVNNNTGRHAQVNVLVFNSANEISEFDFTYNKSTEGDDDYYNSTPGSSKDFTYEGLENVSLEINGVNVSSTKEVTVNNVEINNANLGAGIVVGGDLTVKGGNVVADVAKVEGALTIEAGKGKITATTIGSVNIESDAFDVNAETIEGNVTATGENYFNVETIGGYVVLTNNSATVTHIEGATIAKDVTLNGNFDLRGVTIKGNLTINKGTVKANNINIEQTLTVKAGAEIVISGNDAKITHIDNYGQLTTNVDVYTETVEIFAGSSAVVAENKTIWYNTPSYGENGYTQLGKTDGAILYSELTYVSTKEDLPKDNDKYDTNITENVVLFGDLALSASETNANSGYKGGTGVKVVGGGVLDGQGNTLTVTDANETWGCAIATTGGTIKNLTVAGAMRGIFMPGATADVYIDNVIFKDVVYTFNSDAGNKSYGVYLSNCTINGWTSHSDVHKEVVYTNCSFGEGSGYKFCRPYGNTTFTNCAFEKGYTVDAYYSKNGSILSYPELTFVNCTLDGQPLTAANIAELIDEGDPLDKVTIEFTVE